MTCKFYPVCYKINRTHMIIKIRHSLGYFSSSNPLTGMWNRRGSKPDFVIQSLQSQVVLDTPPLTRMKFTSKRPGYRFLRLVCRLLSESLDVQLYIGSSKVTTTRCFVQNSLLFNQYRNTVKEDSIIRLSLTQYYVVKTKYR